MTAFFRIPAPDGAAPCPAGGFLLPAGTGPQAVSTASKHTGFARVGGFAAGPAARNRQAQKENTAWAFPAGGKDSAKENR